MGKPIMHVLNKTGSFTYCPFCRFLNDDSQEMTDHIRDHHKKQGKLRYLRDVDNGVSIHVFEEADKQDSVCPTCNGRGMVPMGPFVRGLKVCPDCHDGVNKGVSIHP